MSADFYDWTPDDSPGSVIPVDADDLWREQLRARFARGRESRPLERLMDVVADRDVRSVVVEHRYIDLDYRSEHSRFYSTTFRRYPSVCQRLHFFSSEVTGSLKSLEQAAPSYLGYSVMRPLPNSPVGRTVVMPPRVMEGGAVCISRDVVHLWGQRLVAKGMPFTSQDAQYLRCAHSALWMCLYHASLRHGMPRRLPSDIQEAALGGNILGRQLPSDGLSVGQMLKALHELRMATGNIKLHLSKAQSRADHRLSLIAIVCRYVNSDLPPIVYSKTHAWVVVGYKHNGLEPAHDNITLFRHDDARGPYLPVDDPWNEAEAAHRPWRSAIPALPQKMYMSAERAELVGEARLRRHVKRLDDDHLLSQLDGQTPSPLTVRTYGCSATEFLASLRDRVPVELENFYRVAPLSRWVWVVELVDRHRLYAGQPAVVGEALIDATASNLSTSDDQVVLARRLWENAIFRTPDRGVTRALTIEGPDYVQSGSPALRGWSPTPDAEDVSG